MTRWPCAIGSGELFGKCNDFLPRLFLELRLLSHFSNAEYFKLSERLLKLGYSIGLDVRPIARSPENQVRAYYIPDEEGKFRFKISQISSLSVDRKAHLLVVVGEGVYLIKSVTEVIPWGASEIIYTGEHNVALTQESISLSLSLCRMSRRP